MPLLRWSDGSEAPRHSMVAETVTPEEPALQARAPAFPARRDPIPVAFLAQLSFYRYASYTIENLIFR